MDVVLSQKVDFLTKQLENSLMLTIGKNLFDKSKVTSEKYVDSGTGNLLSLDTQTASDFIPVKANTNYVKTTNHTHAYYDSSKKVISGVNGLTSFTTPSNCAYVRISVVKTALNYYQLEEGTVATSYEPFKLLFNSKAGTIDITNVLQVKPTMYTGLVMATLGDSITQQFKWQPVVQKSLRLAAAINYGISGTRIADTNNDVNSMCRDERINAIDSNSDIIVVMGGMNDWLQSVPLGAITDTGVTTFYGAVKTMLQKLITRFPSKPIVLMTTSFGLSPNRAGWTDTTGLTNNLSLESSAYSAVTKEVAQLYDIPVADVYTEAGWNKDNISIFTDNDGAFIHPNTYGATKVANILVKKLKEIEPAR